MTAAPERRVPDVTLERFRLRELPPEEMESIEQQLRTDPELRHRFDSLAADRRHGPTLRPPAFRCRSASVDRSPGTAQGL